MPGMEYKFRLGPPETDNAILSPSDESQFIKRIKNKCDHYMEPFEADRLIRFSPPFENCARKRIVLDSFAWPLNSRQAKEAKQLNLFG